MIKNLKEERKCGERVLRRVKFQGFNLKGGLGKEREREREIFFHQ